MKEAEFTVFFSGGFLTSGDCGRHTLQELIQADAGKPLAWAPVFFWGCGKQASELKAESIAAGRTIELIDGRYVPRGVPVEDKPAKDPMAGKSVADVLTATAAGKSLEDYIRETMWRRLTAPPQYVVVDWAKDCAPAEPKRPALTWADSMPFDAFGGFFTEPADMADWQDTYFPR
jgi:hypothetical protein